VSQCTTGDQIGIQALKSHRKVSVSDDQHLPHHLLLVFQRKHAAALCKGKAGWQLWAEGSAADTNQVQ
jgi:hypothetical protein